MLIQIAAHSMKYDQFLLTLPICSPLRQRRRHTAAANVLIRSTRSARSLRSIALCQSRRARRKKVAVPLLRSRVAFRSVPCRNSKNRTVPPDHRNSEAMNEWRFSDDKQVRAVLASICARYNFSHMPWTNRTFGVQALSTFRRSLSKVKSAVVTSAQQS